MQHQPATTLLASFRLSLPIARRPFLGYAVATLILIFDSQACIAQDTQASSEASGTSDTKLEAPNKVEIAPEARDDEIQVRLGEILTATQWFESPEISVDGGVVFLNGIAEDEQAKTWATALARNTQDVVAVVNRMQLRERSIWDFSPAMNELREFRDGAIQAIPLILFAILVLIVTIATAKLISAIANATMKQSVPNPLLRWVATRAIILPILIFGVYLILRVSGLTQLALTVLGGTGLVGLIIGIAFRDIAENFLASILISVQNPFRIDDLVEIGEHSGIVQQVTTRGTTLMTPDGNLVQIPNSQIYKSAIINYTANADRRISFDVGIGYDDSPTEAQETVLQRIRQHSATLEYPAPRVLIETLGASTVNLRVFFWIDGKKHDVLSVRSSVMRIAKQALEKNGISMPDEAREVIFPKGVPIRMSDLRTQSALEHSGAQDPDDNRPTVIGPAGNDNLESEPREEKAESEAEGNMQANTEELKRQAKNSWLPGSDAEVLIQSDEAAESPKNKQP